MSGRVAVLVTVHGPQASEDMALAADVPVSQLIPPLTSLVGGRGGQWTASSGARWHLLLHDKVLPPTRSLADSGVTDGDELHVQGGG
jgi:uncharacterized ubiquitin-like protein YukD